MGGCSSSSSGDGNNNSSSGGGDDASNCYYGSGRDRPVAAARAASTSACGPTQRRRLVSRAGLSWSGPRTRARTTEAPRRSAARSTTPRARTRSTTWPSTCRTTPLQPLTSGAVVRLAAIALHGRSGRCGASPTRTGHFMVDERAGRREHPARIQIGKWRKQFTLANGQRSARTTRCRTRSLTLPKSHMRRRHPATSRSRPGAATRSSACCARMGVDAAEYVPGRGRGRRSYPHLHRAGGAGGAAASGGTATIPGADALGPATADMMQYDIVLLSCEGDETRHR